MKSFLDFMNEATIRGNTGIPGEGPDAQNENPYLRSIEDSARRKTAGQSPQSIGPRMGMLMNSNRLLSRGKEEELEKFAEEIIKDVYSGFMDSVELDLKIVRDGGQVKRFMDEEDQKKKERNKKEKPASKEQSGEEQLRKSDNPELKLEIDKRKLANSITQGEAKNTKLIIQTPECLEGLIKIFGQTNGQQLHSQLLELTDLADKMDWIIPVQAKADMMERHPEGMAGACSVDWIEKEKEEKEEGDDNDQILQDLLGQIQNQEDGIDLNQMSDQLEEVMSDCQPIIRVRGIDFIMLIHEAVKGIYELITSRGIPQDQQLAANVFINTETFADEAEDFRYGPPIAADLRDFINQNPKTVMYPNVREFVFGKMMEIPAPQFTELMKGILMKSAAARTQIDRMIQQVITELEDFEKEQSEYEMNKRFSQESEVEGQLDDEQIPDEPITPAKSFDQMSISEIQAEIEKAVEEENYELAGELTKKYLKGESKKVWETELQRINENVRQRR